ncbi:very short patch repair endonuclease [Nocardioides korecus]
MVFDDVEEHVRRRMANTRGRDTRPEMAVRRELHRLGYRYRVNYAPVPGVRRTADIVFTKKKLAVCIDGCFWHGCPEHYRPSTGQRAGFWSAKIEANVHRDRETTALWLGQGWSVVRFWEHEEPSDVVGEIRALLGHL